MSVRQKSYVIPLFGHHPLNEPVHPTHNTGNVNLLCQMRGSMIPCLQVQRNVWIALSNISGVSKIVFVENNDFEVYLHFVITFSTSRVGYAAIEAVPTCNLFAARPVGRDREIIQMSKPRLSDTTLRLACKGIAMGIA